jgi:hypothetical protein
MAATTRPNLLFIAVGCFLHIAHISDHELAATLTLGAVLADWDPASTWNKPDFEGSIWSARSSFRSVPLREAQRSARNA